MTARPVGQGTSVSSVTLRQGESISLLTGQVFAPANDRCRFCSQVAHLGLCAPAKAVTECDTLLGTNNLCTLRYVFAVMIADAHDARFDAEWMIDNSSLPGYLQSGQVDQHGRPDLQPSTPVNEWEAMTRNGGVWNH